jgi:hypothetical protein
MERPRAAPLLFFSRVFADYVPVVISEPGESVIEGNLPPKQMLVIMLLTYSE